MQSMAPIRDSVTGNVKVHASATYDLVAYGKMPVWIGLLSCHWGKLYRWSITKPSYD